MTIFYCLRFETPNLEGQVPVFISPRNWVARLYPQTLDSLFVSSYDSQGYGGGSAIVKVKVKVKLKVKVKVKVKVTLRLAV
jgi:hypothetical protein